MAADQGVSAEPVPTEAEDQAHASSLLKRVGVAASMRSSSAHRLRRGYWHVANALRRRPRKAAEGEWR
jgi:hypothetical protein